MCKTLNQQLKSAMHKKLAELVQKGHQKARDMMREPGQGTRDQGLQPKTERLVQPQNTVRGEW